MAKESSKSDKKIKPAQPLSLAPTSTGEGTVPNKGGTQVAQESGGRNAPLINIGIERQDRAAIAEGLSRVLADTYTLYLTTHNFHWNVTGPHFNSLHAMFMDQYTELWNATDVIAERIRALGHYAPGSYAEFSKIGRASCRERV